MDWLKQLLKDYVDEDKQEEFTLKHNKLFEKHAVQKSKFNSVSEELEEYKSKTEDLQQQISKIGTNDKSKELKAELEKVQNEFNEFKGNTEKRELNRSKKIAVEKSLQKADAVPDALDLLTNTFNLDEITLTEKGDVVDFESKLNKLKESKPSLFKVTETNSTATPGDAINDTSDNLSDIREAMGL